MNIKKALVVMFLGIFGCAPRVVTQSSWVVPLEAGNCLDSEKFECYVSLCKDTTVQGNKVLKNLFTLIMRLVNKTDKWLPGLQAFYITDNEGLRVGLFTPAHYASYITGTKPIDSDLLALMTIAAMNRPSPPVVIQNPQPQSYQSFGHYSPDGSGGYSYHGWTQPQYGSGSRMSDLGAAVGRGMALGANRPAKLMLLSQIMGNQQEWQEVFNKAQVEFLRLRPLRPHETYAGKVWFTTAIDKFPITLHIEEASGIVTELIIPTEALEEAIKP